MKKIKNNIPTTKAVLRKSKTIIVVHQFTFKGILYKVGKTFEANKKEVDLLINKNFIKWQ